MACAMSGSEHRGSRVGVVRAAQVDREERHRLLTAGPGVLVARGACGEGPGNDLTFGAFR